MELYGTLRALGTLGTVGRSFSGTAPPHQHATLGILRTLGTLGTIGCLSPRSAYC